MVYLLAGTAIGTLILNLLLTRYLLKNKLAIYSTEADKEEVVSFTLTPPVQQEEAADTEIFATEIISAGGN